MIKLPKIKIKHIILILLFIFLIYNLFNYKEHFDEEVLMPGRVLQTRYTIPKLVFKSYEGCLNYIICLGD